MSRLLASCVSLVCECAWWGYSLAQAARYFIRSVRLSKSVRLVGGSSLLMRGKVLPIFCRNSSN